MRLPGAGCVAVLGLLWLGFSASAQVPNRKPSPSQNPPPVESSPNWLGTMFATKAKPDATTEKPTMTVTDRALEQDRLMKAYLRRQDVCDRLREIAHQTSDQTLFEEATRLEEMAWKIYQAQSSKLLGISTASLEEDPASRKPESSTLEILKGATKGGVLPPRLRSGGPQEPTRAERKDERGREER